MQGMRTELTSSVNPCALQAVGRSNICAYHKNLAQFQSNTSVPQSGKYASHVLALVLMPAGYTRDDTKSRTDVIS